MINVGVGSAHYFYHKAIERVVIASSCADRKPAIPTFHFAVNAHKLGVALKGFLLAFIFHFEQLYLSRNREVLFHAFYVSCFLGEVFFIHLLNIYLIAHMFNTHPNHSLLANFKFGSSTYAVARNIEEYGEGFASPRIKRCLFR